MSDFNAVSTHAQEEHNLVLAHSACLVELWAGQ
jgi:hypothetical protein